MSAVDVAAIGADAKDRATAARGRWSSRAAFVLAAASSAVGLGNIWKFPYITGENGGGWFVVVYLLSIVLVAAPIMIAEVLIGRSSRRSPVGALRLLSRGSRRWMAVGWLAIVAAFLILSYYFVVAGWTLHYAWLALSGQLLDTQAEQLHRIFAGVYANSLVNLSWQFVFIAITVGIVITGVQKGLERSCRVLFPMLLVMMTALVVHAAGGPGFTRAVQFVFGAHGADLTARGVLEALGHSFFSLSLGMGAMITYGSYLSRREDAVAAAGATAGLDTLVSLLACMMIFPIIFASGLEPNAGPGLVFVSMPMAFAQMPAGQLWAVIFFALLAIAALTSTISLLEAIVSHLADERATSRRRASLISGFALFIAGVPVALSGGTYAFGGGFQSATAALFGGAGRNWFDFVDYIASNWLLPISGLGAAVFFAWSLGAQAREEAFKSGTRFAKLYWSWVWLLRYFVPPAVIAVFVHATGLI